jgi:Zn-dependent protease
MPELSILQQIVIWFLPVLLAITLHEAAHAWVAAKLGDTTAKVLGRLSLNPFKHVDFIGTILVPLVILLSSDFNFIFGWAKPVPISSAQLKNPRKDMLLVTAAGPGSNLLMAFTFFHPQAFNPALFILLTARAGIIINLLLAYLNLIPLPPLDGGRIMANLLTPKWSYYYQRIEPFGFLILFLLMLLGILSWFLTPLVNMSLSFLQKIFFL